MYEYKAKFKNGDILKDIVTGFEGTIMVVAFYSTGCTHYGLAPKVDKSKNKIDSWEWLDESRLVKASKKSIIFPVNESKKSGPMPNGPSM
jgi:hypothetical protein